MRIGAGFTLSSKLMYGLSSAALCMNFFFTNRGWWSIPVIIAVSASPVFSPSVWNVALSVCAVLSMGAIGLNLVSGMPHRFLPPVAITSAALSMLLGFFKYYLRQKREPQP
jgi:hypothetical protein